ncbi:Uncharacterised protein [Mycobacteroides abscessus subsp. abscessus]|nr:Uncharacterised protein [Mycobacteroides abscessus subsp. abscessus]
MSGRQANTVARAPRLRCPPDRWCGLAPACCVIDTASSASATRCASSGPSTPKFAGPKATSSASVGMNNWSSGSWNTSPTRRRTSRSVDFPTGEP